MMGRQSILVVDNGHDMIRLLDSILKIEGFDTVTVADGETH